jgi:GcrA cell cycle regulator
METSHWAPEHSGALQEYLALGMPYSEIARAINAKFGTHYSRNATISRARRIGLGGPARRPELTPLPPKELQLSERLLRQRFAAMSKRFERVETSALRCVDIEPRHLSLLELEGGHCRYPYGGDADGKAITFCGHPQREESSYCTAHFHLTRGTVARPEGTVSSAPLRSWRRYEHGRCCHGRQDETAAASTSHCASARADPAANARPTPESGAGGPRRQTSDVTFKRSSVGTDKFMLAKE